MGKAVAGSWRSPLAEGTPALVVTAIFFALGGLMGCLLALGATGGGAEALGRYLERFLASAQAGTLTAPAVSELLWRALRWPLAVFLLGFTALGLLGVPALAALRGFLLAFSIASFGQAYGRGGLAISFFLLGVPGAISVPVFFLLSAQSFTAALELAGRAAGQGRRELPYHRDYFFRCGLCAAAVCVSILFEQYLSPVLVAGCAGTLLR